MAAGAGEPRPLWAPKPLPPGKRLAPPLARSLLPSFLPSLLPSLPLPPTRQPPPGQARRHRPSTFTPRRHRSPSNRRLAATPDKAQDSIEAWRTAWGGSQARGPASSPASPSLGEESSLLSVLSQTELFSPDPPLWIILLSWRERPGSSPPL